MNLLYLSFLWDYLAHLCILCYNIYDMIFWKRRIIMPVSYDKLRKLLIDKKMKRTELKDAAGIKQ